MKRFIIVVTTTLLTSAVGLCQDKNYPPVVKDIRIGATNLPIVFIQTLGHETEEDNRVSAWMKIINNVDGVNYEDTVAHPGQTIDYEGYIWRTCLFGQKIVVRVMGRLCCCIW